LPAPSWRAISARGVAIQVSEPEEVMVRGVMVRGVMVVVVVAVPVAPAPRPHTFGLREEQECDREKQGELTGAPVHHARSLHRGTSDL